MSGNFLALAQPGVQQLSPYVPGKPVDEHAKAPGFLSIRKSWLEIDLEACFL